MEHANEITKPVVEIPVKEITAEKADTDAKTTIQEQIQRILEEPDKPGPEEIDTAEAEAFQQITQILCGLDKKGPVYTAFAGCLNDAEMNLTQGTCCSMEERNETLTKENEDMAVRMDELQRRVSKLTEEIALFAERLSDAKVKNAELSAQLSGTSELYNIIHEHIQNLDAQIIEFSRHFLDKDNEDADVSGLSLAFTKKDLLESILRESRETK
jgi:chromosome segregation ATPase